MTAYKQIEEQDVTGFRLSPQQRLYWRKVESGESKFFNSTITVKTEGELNHRKILDSLNRVVQKHEILRTKYERIAGMRYPLQVVNGTDCESSYCLVQEESEQDTFDQDEWDWAGGPLIRVSLREVGLQKHMMKITVPGISADPKSLRNLVGELHKYYGEDADHCPPSESMQYILASEWLNGLLEAEDSETDGEYWRWWDAESIAQLSLPLEETLSDTPPFLPRSIKLNLSTEISEIIRRHGDQYGLTAKTYMLACWCVLLGQLTGHPHLCVALGCDGRNYEGLEDAIGPYAKYVPLMADLDSSQRFCDLLQRINESIIEVEQWQECFDWEQATANAVQKYFPFCYEWQEAPEIYQSSKIRATIRLEQAHIDRFKLKLLCRTRQEIQEVEIYYDNAIYTEGDMIDLKNRLEVLIKSAAKGGEDRISNLRILSDRERAQVTIGFNRETEHPVCSATVHWLFEETVEKNADRTAVIWEGEKLSYRELNERANQVAHYLISKGVGPETLVGIYLERSVEMVVCLLGVLKAGGAYVPLDPTYPAERLAYMLEDCCSNVVIKHSWLKGIERAREGWEIRIDQDRRQIGEQRRDNPGVMVKPENLAYVIYTSGSTGLPKGVMITHEALNNHMQWIVDRFGITNDVLLQKTAFSFDASVWEFYAPLISGGTLVMAQEGKHQDVNYLVKAIIENNVTLLQVVPTLFGALLENGDCWAYENLRVVFCGGEELTAELVERNRSRNRGRLCNLYGPTEATIDATYWESRESRNRIPIGRPVWNVLSYVLDDRLEPVAIGALGELYIGGKGIARGYLNKADLTADRFVLDPFTNIAGQRLYRTGDLARYLPTGEIEYRGRRDHQVKIRGYRIELGEVEASLRRHPSVAEAVVDVRETKAGKQLVGYVVGREGGKIEEAEMKSYLSQRLPEYMVPGRVMVIEKMPLMANGKLDRESLRRQEKRSENAEQKAKTQVEEIVEGVWSEVLGLEKVRGADNFFDLGGHSLLATQIVSRLKEIFRAEILIRSLFESSTMVEFSSQIESALKAGKGLQTPPIVKAPRGSNRPLSFAQLRLWFIDQLEPANPAYNIPVALRLKGRLNRTALSRSLQEVVRRHEALRTRFPSVDGVPVQVVTEVPENLLSFIDLSQQTKEESERSANELGLEERGQGFDLEKGSLLRGRLVKVGEDDHILFLTMHHIVSDGWSMWVFVREMTALYNSYNQDRPSPLGELNIQYSDYAIWQREWLKGEALERELVYWRKQLSGLPMLNLHTDKPRQATQAYAGATQSLLLSEGLTAQLKVLSRQEATTLFMTLLAAFKFLLYRYTAQTDIAVGTGIANRNRSETEDLIGFFVNMLVLRTDLSGSPSFRTLLRRVREVTLEAYAHQDLPFGKLVDELQPARSLSHTPLFQVVFILQNLPPPVLELPGLNISRFELNSHFTHFDLMMSIGETREGLVCTISYNTDIFGLSTIIRMLQHYRAILEAIVVDPDLQLLDLALATEDIKHLSEVTSSLDGAHFIF